MRYIKGGLQNYKIYKTTKYYYVLKDFEKCNADEVEIDIIDEHRAAITTKYTLIDFLENFISQCISDNSYISVEKYQD